MQDINRLYALPYDKNEPIVCIDEKPYQILENARPSLSLKTEVGLRVDCDYIRKGTCNIFVGVEPKGGFRHTRVTEHRKKQDYVSFFLEICHLYRDAKKIHIVCDNLNIHKLSSLQSILSPNHPVFSRVVLHFTPIHASWQNLAEVEIGILSRQCLNRRIPTFAQVKGEVAAWNGYRNCSHAQITWRLTESKAQAKYHLTHQNLLLS